VNHLAKRLFAVIVVSVLAVLSCFAGAPPCCAQTFTNLLSFDGTDGAEPYAALTQGIDGNFYGTTTGGGSSFYGVAFRITLAGEITTLYTFCTPTGVCNDGGQPFGGLIQGIDGNFYGTTRIGGAANSGTVFRITPSGQFTLLHTFCMQTNCPDGDEPLASLVQNANGNFYGTTWIGGTSNNGTVFEMTPSGELTTLYTFCSLANCADGALPEGGLVQASNGNFYGTTEQGGSCFFEQGCGTLFEITPAGKFTTLHRFAGGDDGFAPQNSLVLAANGNFYGTTTDGGGSTQCGDGCGTVFEMTPTGKVTILYSFCEEVGCPDGYYPDGALMQGTNGNFYGTASHGGANNGCYNQYTTGCGTIFEITPSGKLGTLYSFCDQANCADGSVPWAGLIQSTNGIFYGTTTGDSSYGNVFSLSVGLKPFLTTKPAFGKDGSSVVILGNHLKGATQVTFSGTAAKFTVVSATEIKALVPGGATTGFVQVTVPTGTLTSNLPFHVTQ
jgi:uncharacterized repeat protein (TIGR03803 family)